MKLLDACEFIIDCPHSSAKDEGAGYPLVRTPNVGKGRLLLDNVHRVSEKIYNERNARAIPSSGDLILAREAPVGNVAIIQKDQKVCLGQRVVLIRPNKEKSDPDFLVYYLLSDNIQYKLKNYANGAVVSHLNVADIRNLEIQLPKIEIQKRVGSVLSSLDAKIENNNKINAKLEEMAQALFKSWFIDFEPFKDGTFVESELGMIPEGWKVVTLGSQCVCLLGGTPSRNKEEYWGGNINWINSGEINKFRILTPSEKITSLGLSKSATKLLPAKTTVLAITGATLGQVSLLEIDSCANQSVIGVLQNELMPYEFVYPLINEAITELVTHQTGGAQQHINKDNVESLKIILPNIDIINSYKTVVAPIYSKIANLCFENLNLEKTRDTLLPKLMSGEIEL